MNVEREIAAADRRVRALIEQRADEALIRLGFDPVAERAQAAAERRAAELREIEEAGRNIAATWRAIADAATAAIQPILRLVLGIQDGLS